MTPGKVAYLYCFARADLLPPLNDPEGQAETSPLLLRKSGDLVAVMSEVPVEEFTGPDAEAHLNDLAWLAPRALHHERVVEEVGRHSPVFPARFGTIFSSLEPVDALLSRHHDAIRGFLDRTETAEEWSLKGYIDRKRAQDELVEEELASGGSAALPASPGMRYMQERKLKAQADLKVRDWLEKVAERVEAEVSGLALEVRARKLIPSTERPGEMVINLALLVPRAGVDAFRGVATQLGQQFADKGLELEVAGPFPAYSFTPALDRGPQEAGERTTT